MLARHKSILIAIDTLMLLLWLIVTPTRAQEANPSVCLEVWPDRSHIRIDEGTVLLVHVDNGTDSSIQLVRFDLYNPNLPSLSIALTDTVLPASSRVFTASVGPFDEGKFVLWPVITYSTAQGITQVQQIPQILPEIEVVRPPTFLSSFASVPKETVSVLIGALISLICVGLTSYMNHRIELRRSRSRAKELARASVRGTLNALQVGPAVLIPIDLIRLTTSSPQFEHILALATRHGPSLGDRLAAWPQHRPVPQSPVGQVPRLLGELHARAEHYLQASQANNGMVSVVIRDALSETASTLDSLLPML